MVGQLVTLPLRIWLRSVQLTLRVGEELTGRALEAASGLVEAMGATGESERSEPVRSRPPDPPPPHRESAPERPHRAATRTGTPRPKQPPEIRPVPPIGVTPGDTVAPESPVAPPASNEPSHVSEELELVAESAEPRAEDGKTVAERGCEEHYSRRPPVGFYTYIIADFPGVEISSLFVLNSLIYMQEFHRPREGRTSFPQI